MKTYDEIRRIITEHFGIVDLRAYSDWLSKWRSEEWTPAEEDINLLSPDEIDCFDFWKVVEDLFGIDGVCNTVDSRISAVDLSKMNGNRANLNIARTLGCLSTIDQYAYQECNLLEYGTGYGSLKNYVEVTTRFNYSGWDVYPKVPDVHATTRTGYLPPEFVMINRGQFHFVVSSNVLQHVSTKQKLQFFSDAHDLLCRNGQLIVNVPILPTKHRSKYMTLYGQFIEMPTRDTFFDWVADKFDVLATTESPRQYMIGVVLSKKS